MPKLRERLAGLFNSASSTAISARVTTDAHDRIAIDAGGRMSWGSGAASADVTLYRNAADVLKTDDQFVAASVAFGATTLQTVTAQTSSTTSLQLLDATVATAIKYVVYADNGTHAEVTEILAINHNGNVRHTEYAKVATSVDVATYDVTLGAGSLELRVTPASTSTTTFTVSKQVLL
jgi:hypothetical protein